MNWQKMWDAYAKLGEELLELRDGYAKQEQELEAYKELPQAQPITDFIRSQKEAIQKLEKELKENKCSKT